MKKKDYELIASSVNLLVKGIIAQGKNALMDTETVNFTVNQFINSLARKLSDDNPKFDWDKFIELVNKE